MTLPIVTFVSLALFGIFGVIGFTTDDTMSLLTAIFFGCIMLGCLLIDAWRSFTRVRYFK
jgi:hypothetical protein